jgi:hypothetical protein
MGNSVSWSGVEWRGVVPLLLSGPGWDARQGWVSASGEVFIQLPDSSVKK